MYGAAVSNATLWEAGIWTNASTYSPWGSSGSGLLLNRVVFPSSVSVTTGQQIIITASLSIPTLAVTPQTVTLGAQNGINVSGQLKLIGTSTGIIGGTVTTAGAETADTSVPLLGNWTGNTSYYTTQWGLNANSSFPAWNTASSWGTSTWATTSAAGSYTSGSYNNTYMGYWAVGNPATNTSFQSLVLTNSTSSTPSGSGLGGYQLLLTSPATTSASGLMYFGLNFAVA